MVGVNDRGQIIGIPFGPETAQQWVNQVKSSTAPTIIPDIESLLIDGKTIAKITISEYPIQKITQKTTQKATQKITQKKVDELLDLLRDDPRMSRDELAARLNKNPNTVKYHIKKLKDAGKLERIGSDRDGYWRVISDT